MIASPSARRATPDGCSEPARSEELTQLGWQLAGGAPYGPPAAWIAIAEHAQASARVLARGDEVGSARHLAAARAAIAQLRDDVSADLEREVASLLDGHRDVAEPRWLELPAAALRATVEARSARTSGACARFAAMLGARAAGCAPSRIAEISRAAAALGIARRMAEDLTPTALDADLRALRPSWAWVWTAERADAPSWVRTGRWAVQIARTGSDPTPLARLLQQFAARHGCDEVRAKLERAYGALDRIHS